MKDARTPPAAGAESSRPQTLKDWFAAHPKRSQRWLAAEADCNQSFISMLAKGERDAGGKLAEKLHEITGLPLKAFLHATDLNRRRKRGPPRAACMVWLLQVLSLVS